jgi:membrane protease subunit HflC
MSRKRRWILLLLAGAAAIYLLSAFYVVDVTEYAVVTRFGNPVAIHTEPGLRFDPWRPIESITRIDSRLLVLDVEEAEYLTKDKKNVVASGYVLWRVEDPLKYLQRVFSRSGAESRISDILSSQIGAALGGVPFSALVSTEETEIRLDAVVQSIFEKSREIVRRDYGVRLEEFRIKRLAFPIQNKKSVFERMRAERQRIARGYRSEGEEQSLRIRAEADRRSTELLAEARGQAEAIRGEGEAEATRTYAAAIRRNPDFYKFLRTLESYEKIINEKTTIVIPSDSELMELLMRGPGSSE